MNKFIYFFIIAFINGTNLRLAHDFYDNRIPKSINSYKETSSKIILKESTYFYKNGYMSYKVEYDANGLNSKKTWWHNNGNRSKMITFNDGKIDGIWITWSYDGLITSERFYNDGLMIKERVRQK